MKRLYLSVQDSRMSDLQVFGLNAFDSEMNGTPSASCYLNGILAAGIQIGI